MGAEIIDGKAIANDILDELRCRVIQRKDKGLSIPKLVAVVVGEDPASRTYVTNKSQAASDVGMDSDVVMIPESTDDSKLSAILGDLNDRSDVHGIILQLPIPSHLDEVQAISSICLEKDVDGLTDASLGRLSRGDPVHSPATPSGILEILRRTNISTEGSHAVIVGRSMLVGRPLSIMLSQRGSGLNAIVTLVHTGARSLGKFTRSADILIVATGQAKTITADLVSPGTTVIDVGTNWILDSTRKNGRRLVGDVDFEGVKTVAKAVTPVPGGVGPMTVAMLLSNTLSAAEILDGR
ncbi:MAG TPA: bifunctional 5,10-methylenetetrahydrofolate dehydrogenase/5,10-methenyltetrahydrofolate cyclohydrolase [Dehalococcoidia bacterium]|nr:bifunctional 5,10-methylenetetrahydrofolate dehydrogenase/5,10-methenyltetrahydrofolate cyclohydrolase [Dehalococcoidia bacterium]